MKESRGSLTVLLPKFNVKPYHWNLGHHALRTLMHYSYL